MLHLKKHISQVPLIMAVILLLAITATAATPPPQKVGTVVTKPLKLLPDLTVTSIALTLVKTTAGVSGVEFPVDRVSVVITVQSIGAVPPPADFTVYTYRNTEKIDTFTISPSKLMNGKIVYTFYDNFPHGMETIYRSEVATTFNEVSVTNNAFNLTVNDTKLHSTNQNP